MGIGKELIIVTINRVESIIHVCITIHGVCHIHKFCFVVHIIVLVPHAPNQRQLGANVKTTHEITCGEQFGAIKIIPFRSGFIPRIEPTGLSLHQECIHLISVNCILERIDPIKKVLPSRITMIPEISEKNRIHRSKHFAGEKILDIRIIILRSRSLKRRFHIVPARRPADLTSELEL